MIGLLTTHLLDDVINQNNNNNRNTKKWAPVAKDFVAGSVGGMSSIFTGHPFDTIKVMLQQESTGNTPKFKNGYQALRYVIQIDGIRGVYKGLSVPLASVSVINSIFFATNNYCQRLFHQDPNTLIPYHKVAMAGGIAGGVISFFITPRDLIKSKLQVQNRNMNLMATVTTASTTSTTATSNVASQTQQQHINNQHQHQHQHQHQQRIIYNGPIDCIKSIVKEDGWKGLFKGIRITFVRDFLGDMVYFCTYEALKRNLITFSDRFTSSSSPTGTPGGDKPSTAAENTIKIKSVATNLPPWVAICAGGCAGMSFWFSIYPLDVIKTRIQTQPNNSPLKYGGIIDCAKMIYKQEGLSAFYRGFTATLFRAFPTSAINFLMYETTRKLLNSKTLVDDYTSSLEAT
ncbi:mitochondrial substrate carrier family protein [Cavenderia fasciculata]|uniref:Mitochondrial substrate carrier family protein n=1 Tax=Cavenderia fasciculata TaxID=261658 RepID=F4Q069_CACFS|nr:mitochondrial substrate carrier family protein [Cavenderia fasciculata]EGG18749.1 mitochondrial substrate carrier family protein [Cavenderia fasciculata]|eukprot:XP_004357211.1 mitochondrial substrate carrier family protein [Cavenderia fasciculata]